MTNKLVQRQEGGDGSTNIQAQSVSISGITHAEARQIALDAMRAELGSLTGNAERIAQERMTFYADGLLARLAERPELLERFAEPRTQISVRDAHRLHAKRGTDDVAELTLDMLVDFIACQGSDFKSVVLNDAIETTHKLTTQQIDALSVLVVVRHYELTGDTLEDWCNQVADLAGFFAKGATRSPAELDYLVTIGCADFEVMNQTFAQLFNMRYKALSASLFQQQSPDPATHNETVQWSNNVIKTSKRLLDTDTLTKAFDDHSDSMRRLREYFDTTKLARMNLRITGRAIGAANLRHKKPKLPIADEIWFDS